METILLHHVRPLSMSCARTVLDDGAHAPGANASASVTSHEDRCATVTKQRFWMCVDTNSWLVPLYGQPGRTATTLKMVVKTMFACF